METTLLFALFLGQTEWTVLDNRWARIDFSGSAAEWLATSFVEMNHELNCSLDSPDASPCCQLFVDFSGDGANHGPTSEARSSATGEVSVREVEPSLTHIFITGQVAKSLYRWLDIVGGPPDFMRGHDISCLRQTQTDSPFICGFSLDKLGVIEPLPQEAYIIN